MPNHPQYYFYTETGEPAVSLHGVSFRDFLAAFPAPPANLLLLAHEFHGGRHDPCSGFTYVTGADVLRLAGEAGGYGAFRCIDFENADSLALLPPRDIAALLYFAHRGSPLEKPFFAAVLNRFAWCGGDGGRLARVYCRDLNDFHPVLSAAVSAVTDTLQAAIRPLPADKAASLLKLSEEGLLLDGGELSTEGNKAELPFYIVGRLDSAEDLLAYMDSYKNNAIRKGVLRFTLNAPQQKPPPKPRQKQPRAAARRRKRLRDICRNLVNGLP